MKALDKCNNLFGSSLNEDCRGRLERYINNPNPTPGDWDDISSIIIDGSGMGMTVWNALIEFDPTFPKVGRRFDFNWNVVREWERIPPGFIVARAIQEYWKKNTERTKSFKNHL